MKWKRRAKDHPVDGEIKIVSRFLIFPKCIENEYRWLERVNITQKYYGIQLVGNNVVGGYWIDSKWASEKRRRNSK